METLFDEVIERFRNVFIKSREESSSSWVRVDEETGFTYWCGNKDYTCKSVKDCNKMCVDFWRRLKERNGSERVERVVILDKLPEGIE